MKKFKSKKKRKFKWRLLFYIIIIFISYEFSFTLIAKNKMALSNRDFIKCLLADSNYHMLYQRNAKTLLNKLTVLLTKLNIKQPITILENSTHFSSNNNTFSYMHNEVQQIQEPLVYIYNTHQTEGYAGEGLKKYNITPNVLMASYLLNEKLKTRNIDSIVQEQSISEYMNLNNMNYKDSYKASRFFLNQAMQEHNTYKLFIDLHRDSLKKDKTTININNKNYATAVFVVGLDHNNYQLNLDIATKISNLMNKRAPNVSKGIIKKSGKNVNGIYNQDVGGNVVLIEIGGYQNTIDEVLYTVEILSDSIGDYLDGKE